MIRSSWIIDENGRVIQPKLHENMILGLGLAAMDTVCDWRFEPARYQGKPVKVNYGLTITFGR